MLVLTRTGTLWTSIRRRLINNHLVYFPKLAKVFVPFQNLGISQPHGQTHHKNQVLLHYPHTTKQP